MLYKSNRIINPYLEIKITFSLVICRRLGYSIIHPKYFFDSNDVDDNDEGRDVLMTFKFTKGHYELASTIISSFLKLLFEGQ